MLHNSVEKYQFDLRAYLQKNAVNAKGAFKLERNNACENNLVGTNVSVLVVWNGIGKVDEYDTIRVVNYIRSLVQSAPAKYASATAFAIEGQPWKDEQYLKPVLENDPLLFSLEAILGAEDYISSDDEPTPATKSQDGGRDAEIAALQATIAKLKAMNQRLIESSGTSSKKGRGSRSSGSALRQPLKGADSPGSGSGYESDSESDSDSGSDTEAIIDDGYFMAYATFHIHEDMLKVRNSVPLLQPPPPPPPAE